jgi:lysine 2,3-aminomutase
MPDRPDASLPLEEAARRLGASWDATARQAARRLPLRFPTGYLDLADPSDPRDPIRAIAWPHPEELSADPEAIEDPVGEGDRSPHPLLVRKHPDRVILITTKRCHFYCRFCFRAGSHPEPRWADLDGAVRALEGDPQLEEVILSGGDPLTLTDERLGALLARLGEVEGLRSARIHTRAPVHAPERITQALARVLNSSSRLPVWLVTHGTHPRELRPELDGALARLADAGVPVLNQTVLLAGVNDDAETLRRLMTGLYQRRAKPYYLHHPDRIAGTARFRVSLGRGREIYRTLRTRLPGPALPQYVLDLPDGRGKVPVLEMERIGGRLWRYEHPDGSVSRYEDVREPQPAVRGAGPS